MPKADRTQKSPLNGARTFQTTRWTVVLAARNRRAPGYEEALSRLCESYWHPLYCYVRHQGISVEDAQDLVQGFFARLIEKNSLKDFERSESKFRSFLLVSLNNFLANEWNRAKAQKRGGGKPMLSLDVGSGEGRYIPEATSDLSPEKLYEKRWAMALLDKVVARLKAEYSSVGKSELFRLFVEYLVPGTSRTPYRKIASQVGMSEGAVKVAIHRLRKRYREILRDEVAQTLTDNEKVEDEIKYLFTLFGK